MSTFPLPQPLPGSASPVPPPPRWRRPHPFALVGGYWAAFILLHLGATALHSRDGAFLWYFPAALSVALLLILGPRYLPAVILAPLPVDLWLRPLGLPAWTILGMAVSFACGHALAVMAFRRARLSPRLRRNKDVAGFLALAFLGPLLAALPAYLLLRGSGALPAHQLMEAARTSLLSDALGVLTLGPVLLLWVRPLLSLGWRARPGCLPSFRPLEFLLQCAGLALAALVVARFSEPGTLHLKYLLFLPLFWMVVRGGMRAASLGFLVLSLALTLTLLQGGPTADAIPGIQAFLMMLFGAALFLGSAVDAHDLALDLRDRGARRLNQLVAGTGAIPWEMDLETGRCGYLGPGIEALLGWPQEAWRKQPFWGEVMHPDDQHAFLRFLLDVSRPGGHHQLEFRLRTPEGGEHWVRAAGGLDPGHAQGRVMGFLFDIHAHKRAEENALRASLDQKDLLLREIHHRVKNNLQVVSSLLRLQASTLEDPALRRALQEAQERIHAIALIHQKLKHAPDFSRLDLPGYVRTLVERLVRSYASVPALIDLQVRVADVEMGPDAPVPLGLILNELVANALQHAFPPGQGGSLDIEIAPDERGWIALRVADSGQGLPESVDLDRGGLGFQLVQALTDQLGGTLELERRRGASFLIRFPPTPRHP
ncbi:MAG: histidine kinase dimerization/phosphoacceptor domain -containing protein [Geothrix sp.]|nr:histidine kinase dimerization/phosphoacceptor domain -containing protein [Geothrix sp.]